MSIYAHRHFVLSRRDDIEAIGYVLVELLNGDIEWAGLTAETHTEKSEKIRKMKKELKINVCANILHLA